MDEDRANKDAQSAYLYFKLYRCVVSAGSFGICLIIIFSALLFIIINIIIIIFIRRTLSTNMCVGGGTVGGLV